MADVTPSGPTYEYEIVGVFHDAGKLEAAINDLISAGWDRAEMSLIGLKEHIAPSRAHPDPDRATNAERADVVTDTDVRQERTLFGSLGGVAAGFLAAGATIISGGTALAAIIGAAAAAAGGAVGGDLVGQMLANRLTKPIEEQIGRGGVALSLLLRSRDQERAAREILERYGAENIHLHAREDVVG